MHTMVHGNDSLKLADRIMEMDELYNYDQVHFSEAKSQELRTDADLLFILEVSVFVRWCGG